MIKIVRPIEAPSILSNSISSERFNRPQVVRKLHDMQHGKCCYCEDKIPRTGHNKEVEHFRPKRKFPCLTNDWSNLLLACRRCNGTKGDKFPKSQDDEPLLLDPSDPIDNPEDHVDFIVDEDQVTENRTLGLAFGKSGSRKGKETIETIQLDDDHYIEKRLPTLHLLRERFTSLLSERRRIYLGYGDPREVDRLKSALKNACGDDQLYAGLARTFRRFHRLERFGIT